MGQIRTTDFVGKDGGVMTDEVGVITGELTLRTEVDDQGTVVQQVQYKDADEWYHVNDAPAAMSEGQDLDGLHALTVEQLRQS